MVGDRDRRCDSACHRTVEVTDYCVHAINLHELLRTFDAGLSATLAVLGIGQLDFDTGKIELLKRSGDRLDADFGCLVPGLPVSGRITGEAGQNTVLQRKGDVALRKGWMRGAD